MLVAGLVSYHHKCSRICLTKSRTFTMNLVIWNSIAPAPLSGVIVPSLTLIGWPDSLKCCRPWPFPPNPPYSWRPHPSEPQVMHNHKFSFRSQARQCAKSNVWQMLMTSFRRVYRRVIAPEAGIGFRASCWSVSVCSHGTISSSQALTSDWRADESEVMTLLVRAWICYYNQISVSEKMWTMVRRTFTSCKASGTGIPPAGSHSQHLMVNVCSYLSSSRSSTIASFFIFIGGSSSSIWESDKKKGDVSRYRSHTRCEFDLSFLFTFKVNGWLCFSKWRKTCLLSVSLHPPLKQVRQTSIPVGKSLRLGRQRHYRICNGHTCPSKHRVHSSLWINCPDGELKLLSWSRCVQIIVFNRRCMSKEHGPGPPTSRELIIWLIEKKSFWPC